MAKKTIKEIAAWLAENEISDEDLDMASDYNNSVDEEKAAARENLIDAIYDYLDVTCPDLNWTYEEIEKEVTPVLDEIVDKYNSLTKSQTKRVREQSKADAYAKFFKDIGLI
jgi:hypothetical protein